MIGRIFAFAAVAFAALASHGARMASEPWVEHILAGATNGPMDAAYRLMSTDGETYQDATGVVWTASEETTLSPWHVASITYSNGVTVATNALPGVPSWSIDGEWREQSETDEWWVWILSIPEGGSEYGLVASQESAETDTALDFGSQDGSATWSFARTNIVTRSWTPADRVLYQSSGGGGDGGITTNDVCNIVTNEVAGFTEWTFSGQSPISGYHWIVLWSNPYWFLWAVDDSSQHEGPPTSSMEGPDDAVSLTFEVEGGTVVATRTLITRNALGLARLVDLPPLTNGLPTMADIPSTNGLFSSYGGEITGTTKIIGDNVYFEVTDDISVSTVITKDSINVGSGYSPAKVSVGIEHYGGVIEVGEDGIPGTLLVGGTNVMSYISKTVADAQTYANTAIANADTTYKSFALTAPTNINQSVQYLNITAAEPSVLSVLLPDGAGTKDWLIYVQSVTNVSINLPAATWWMADVAYTNDIAPATPTALYFSQIDTGLFLFSRQELSPVTIPAP